MKRIDFGQTINTIANIGVIAGIIFVAIEVQQNSELMRIQINQARADAAMVSNEQSFNSPYIPGVLVKIQQGVELDAEEWLRYVNYFRAMNRNQDNALSQWRAGMRDDNTSRSVEDFACGFIGAADGGLRAWGETKPGYTDSYIDFVEAALDECSGQ